MTPFKCLQLFVRQKLVKFPSLECQCFDVRQILRSFSGVNQEHASPARLFNNCHCSHQQTPISNPNIEIKYVTNPTNSVVSPTFSPNVITSLARKFLSCIPDIQIRGKLRPFEDDTDPEDKLKRNKPARQQRRLIFFPGNLKAKVSTNPFALMKDCFYRGHLPAINLSKSSTPRLSFHLCRGSFPNSPDAGEARVTRGWQLFVSVRVSLFRQ